MTIASPTNDSNRGNIENNPPLNSRSLIISVALVAGVGLLLGLGLAIAKEIGIFKDGDKCLDGTELDNITDEELSAQLEQISVYARVSPVHKIRIVDLWQKKDKVVAMTGDGVNDAPALKKADIGVAMGITGTEVSKDAVLDNVIADKNSVISEKVVLKGTTDHHCFVRKSQIV